MPPTIKRKCLTCDNDTQSHSGVCYRCSNAKRDAETPKRHCKACGSVIARDRMNISPYCSTRCASEVNAISNRACRKVKQAVAAGHIAPIVEGTKCVDCGGQAQEFDHREYCKPLAVDPVCHRCNLRRGPATDIPLARLMYLRAIRPDVFADIPADTSRQAA